MKYHSTKLSNNSTPMKEQTKSTSTADIIKLSGNTTKQDWAGFTDQVIAISKDGKTIILHPEDLKRLEEVVGGKFTI